MNWFYWDIFLERLTIFFDSEIAAKITKLDAVIVEFGIGRAHYLAVAETCEIVRFQRNCRIFPMSNFKFAFIYQAQKAN